MGVGGSPTDSGSVEAVAWHDDRPLLPSRYALKERIGRGGMADVYRAEDELLGREVAVKVFHDAASADDLRRQQAEVRLLAGLSHPHLVTLLDAVPATDGRGSLILEYVDGDDLRSLLDRGALHALATATIGYQIAAALAYIHERDVVHRDVSPGNILLRGTPSTGVVAKLTDLGIARLIDDSRITAAGTVMGTASYMSPEQALGEEVGPATDVYSLGLVLLECLTGRREFPGTALESAAARLHRDPAIPIALHPAWAAVLQTMTARDPAARPSAGHAAQVLDRLSSVEVPAFVETPVARETTAADRTLPLPALDAAGGVAESA